MTIAEELEKIIEKYFDGDRYLEDREISNGDDVSIIDEIAGFFEAKNIVCKIQRDDCYSNCGYDCSDLIIAYVLNGQLYLKTVLLEDY